MHDQAAMDCSDRASARWPEYIQRGTAVSLAFAGVLKLGGGRVMKRQFAHWGYSAGLRRAVGVIELVTSALIVSGRTRPAVTLLALLMCGAAATHIKTPGQRLLAPAPLMFLAVYLAAARSG